MDTKKTILITDDEATFREIFSEKLSAAGYHTITASDGNDCVAKAKEFKPDLILLDMKMPGMDGYEAFGQLRSNPETAAIKIIFVTSLGDPRDGGADDTMAKSIGADGYIKKGDDLSNLMNAVKKCLGEAILPSAPPLP